MLVGIRPHKCHLCGKAFTQKNNLSRHLHVHSLKSCSFDTCDFAAQTYGVLKQHVVQHSLLPYDGFQQFSGDDAECSGVSVEQFEDIDSVRSVGIFENDNTQCSQPSASG